MRVDLQSALEREDEAFQRKERWETNRVQL